MKEGYELEDTIILNGKVGWVKQEMMLIALLEYKIFRK